MAISCKPLLLIADEPTTALDVTIQAQILDLLDRLRLAEGMSVLLITHDLGIVAERADEVAVMYASRIVETSPCEELFAEPLHPYTRGLLEAVPRLGLGGGRLKTLPGNVPDALQLPEGCKFHPRCKLGREDRECQSREPQLLEVRPGRTVACWKVNRIADCGLRIPD
jgi:oligopeptide/dipeptide ABC transporter ATP-binding protein